jgi:hypothetical protein
MVATMVSRFAIPAAARLAFVALWTAFTGPAAAMSRATAQKILTIARVLKEGRHRSVDTHYAH